MADIAAPSAVAPVMETEPEIRTYVAAVAITLGQAVFLNSSGKVDKARANAIGTTIFVGIALSTVDAGKPVAVLQRGSIGGFNLANVAYGDVAFLSTATAGLLQETAGTGTGNFSVPVGRVLAMSDGTTLTKVLFIAAAHATVYAALP